mmetsp:Transcript_7788/g.22904  ORF Transcript_7788/g.22904 Transcript_7788/m.22904 type:complete len:358 (-) Transcript_7788:642-1715(-)
MGRRRKGQTGRYALPRVRRVRPRRRRIQRGSYHCRRGQEIQVPPLALRNSEREGHLRHWERRSRTPSLLPQRVGFTHQQGHRLRGSRQDIRPRSPRLRFSSRSRRQTRISPRTEQNRYDQEGDRAGVRFQNLPERIEGGRSQGIRFFRESFPRLGRSSHAQSSGVGNRCGGPVGILSQYRRTCGGYDGRYGRIYRCQFRRGEKDFGGGCQRHHARYRFRYLSVRHLVQSLRRKCTDRIGSLPLQDSRRVRHRQGVHHPRRRRSLPHRIARRRSRFHRTSFGYRRCRMGHDHGQSPSVRMARRTTAPFLHTNQRFHFGQSDQIGRIDRIGRGENWERLSSQGEIVERRYHARVPQGHV